MEISWIGQGDDAMNPGFTKWAVLLASWIVGAVFIYAGVLKVMDPLEFADSVASFQVLPVALINPVALTLPVLEILLGISIIVGLHRRTSAVLLTLLCGVFAIALGQALLRGLKVDCGCFGAGESSTIKTTWGIGRDLILGGLCCFVFKSSER